MSKVSYTALCLLRMAIACLENLQNGSSREPFMKSITGEKLMRAFSLALKSPSPPPCPPAAPAPHAPAPEQAPPPPHPPRGASKGRRARTLTFSTSFGGSAPASWSILPPCGSRKAAKGTWSAPSRVARPGQTSVLALAKPTVLCSAATASKTLVRCALGACQGAHNSTTLSPVRPPQKALSSASEATSPTAPAMAAAAAAAEGAL
mmetsp:Transcript_28965/g.90160  ORF Transcript_28965/g.90160 Transcript_28965/m.90160 type:complete len:206 (+) Transcript_28965:501-1118(+)